MAWIETNTEQTVAIQAPMDKVFAFLTDVPRNGHLFPGVEKIEVQGEGIYRWILTERSTVGLKFKGDYVTRYTHNGKDEIVWEPISGNIKSRGRWKLVQDGPKVLLTMTVASEADVPVPLPRLVKAIARPFAQSELTKGIETYTAGVKKQLEATM